MKHIIKVTDTINQTLKEIENKRYSEDDFTFELNALRKKIEKWDL